MSVDTGSSGVPATAGGGEVPNSTNSTSAPDYGGNTIQQLYVEAGGSGGGAEQLEGDISPVTGISSEEEEGEGERAAADEGGDEGGPSGQKSGSADSQLPSQLDMSLSGGLGTVEEFKQLMYRMQAIRRRIVTSILHGDFGGQVNGETPESYHEWLEVLHRTYETLTDSDTSSFQRNMLSASKEAFLLNVKDEIVGLEKDLLFLERLQRQRETNPTATADECLFSVDFVRMLKHYHPVSEAKFVQEFDDCVRFLHRFTSLPKTSGKQPNHPTPGDSPPPRLPIMVTDWDGTMKDYCSQYATNLQPVYTALSMARFAERFTRLTAVLTAGPLRGPGILDLTALPIDGPVMFSGSWGREWWLGGKRVVHDDGISEEGIDALERFNDEMKVLLSSREYSQFGLVGSGVQRKVDRLTLGVQTVCGHVQPELSTRYQDQVRERVHRVDPSMRMLHFDPSTELEVEVVLKNNEVVWNKSHGVKRVIETVGDSLEPPGRVLICGDTSSDLPMVQYASSINPEGVMTLFVGANDGLKKRVDEFVPNENSRCFVSCPDVIHAAMMELLRENLAR